MSRTNPYVDLTLVQLWEAMQRQAGELLSDRPRSRRDTAHLILAAAAKIDARTGLGSPAEAVLAGRRLLTEIYGEVYQAEAAAMRHLILCQAADAIGFDYEQRRRVGSPWREAAILAVGSDDGLLLALAMLEDVRRARPHSGVRSFDATSSAYSCRQ